MTTKNTTMDQLRQDARQVRGDKADADWVTTALATLILDEDVDADVAEKAVARVVALMQETGESAEELYGPPSEWVAEKVAGWRENGDEVFSDGPTPVRSFVIVSLIGAVFIALTFAAVWTLGDSPHRPMSPAFFLFPLGLAVLGQGVPEVFRWGQRRFGAVGSILTAGAALLVGAGILAAVAAVLDPLKQHINVGWLWVAPVVYAVLAWFVGKIWPEPAARPQTSSATGGFRGTETEWGNVVSSHLRLHSGYSHREAEAAVAEARAHAREAGTTVTDEFGDPLTYARSLPDAPRRRWWVILGNGAVWAVFLVLVVINIADGGFGWNLATFGSVVGLLALTGSLVQRTWAGRDRS